MTDKTTDKPFWQTKTLEQMTPTEWESLCDGCGRCCLNKLEEEDTGKIFYTDVACRLFDMGTCQCKDYPNRQAIVEDCLQLTPEVVPDTTATAEGPAAALDTGATQPWYASVWESVQVAGETPVSEAPQAPTAGDNGSPTPPAGG